MRAVDTNVLVRLIVRDDPGQAEAAEGFVAQGAWVSHLVLAETLWVLESVYEVDAAGRVRAVEMLLGHRDLVIQEPEVVGRALEHFRKRPALGFSDCLLVECARKAGHGPVGTFDRELAKLEGTRILATRAR